MLHYLACKLLNEMKQDSDEAALLKRYTAALLYPKRVSPRTIRFKDTGLNALSSALSYLVSFFPVFINHNLSEITMIILIWLGRKDG